MKKLLLHGVLVAIVLSAHSAVAQFAYAPAVSGESGIFDGFRRNNAGFFTPLAGSPFGGNGAGTDLNSMLSSPSRKILYTYVGSSVYSYKIGGNGVPLTIGAPLSVTLPSVPPDEFESSLLQAISPDGKYIYLLTQVSDDEGFGDANQLLVLRVQSNGSVTYNPNEVYSFGDGLTNMIEDPSGKFLFVVDESSSLSEYSVQSDGSPKSISVPQPPLNTFLNSIGISPNGKYFYEILGSSYPTELIAVFMLGQNGALTPVPGSPFKETQQQFGVTGQLLMDPNGKFAYALGPLVTNTSETAAIYAFEVGKNGRLLSLPGSPYNLGGQSAPNLTGLKMDPGGYFLVASYEPDNAGPTNWVYLIQSDGTLKQRSNSPSATIPTVSAFVGK